ncbi:MAG TPA: hypothetical protein VF291_00775 [Burkholderiaceae bacterium]|jgi:hypothetical protein
MAVDPFPHLSRLRKPYLVLHEPETGRAAAYDDEHRLVTEHASPALVGYALSRHVHSERWDDLRYVDVQPPPPSWACPEQLGRCTLYWLRDGWTKFRDLLETPDA